MKRMSFDGESITAILAGRKTETTRVVKPQPVLTESPFRDDNLTWWVWKTDVKLMTDALEDNLIETARYHVGDIVAVTETWAPANDNANSIVFKADGLLHAPPIYFAAEDQDVPCYWKPARFMPADLSRITIEITSVAAGRVQEMTLAQIGSEGFTNEMWRDISPQDWWQRRWDALNPQFPYESNPWVRRYGFKVLEVK